MPTTGDYEVSYRIRIVTIPENTPTDKDVLKIDVYNHYSQRITLAQKKLCLKDFKEPEDYNEFKVVFNYNDSNLSLEYRIEILYQDLEVASDLICLRRIS